MFTKVTCPMCDNETRIVNGVLLKHTWPNSIVPCPQSGKKLEEVSRRVEEFIDAWEALSKREYK